MAQKHPEIGIEIEDPADNLPNPSANIPAPIDDRINANEAASTHINDQITDASNSSLSRGKSETKDASPSPITTDLSANASLNRADDGTTDPAAFCTPTRSRGTQIDKVATPPDALWQPSPLPDELPPDLLRASINTPADINDSISANKGASTLVNDQIADASNSSLLHRKPEGEDASPSGFTTDLHTDASPHRAEDQRTGTIPFVAPPKSPGRPEDKVTTSPDDQWQPSPRPVEQPITSQTEDTRTSLLEVFRSTDRTLISIVVFFGGMFVLLVLNQTVAFIDHLARSPSWAQWIGLTALTCALIAMISSVWSLATRYLHLKQTPDLWLNRQQLRKLASSDMKEAKHRLNEFLSDFPSDLDSARNLKRLGFTAESLKSLTDARTELLSPRDGDSRKWLKDLNDNFLVRLDTVAKERVMHYAKRVGLKTAVSPKGFLDSTIVVVNSYLLLTDLCDLYNVRAGRLGTLRLLARIGFNTVIAGNLDQPADILEQQLRDSIQDWATTIVAAVIGKFVAKAAEGGANALLIHRFGKAAMCELRPLKLN